MRGWLRRRGSGRKERSGWGRKKRVEMWGRMLVLNFMADDRAAICSTWCLRS